MHIKIIIFKSEEYIATKFESNGDWGGWKFSFIHHIFNMCITIIMLTSNRGKKFFIYMFYYVSHYHTLYFTVPVWCLELDVKSKG